jgi:hypothetical protein
MASTLLEQTRQLHEDMERAERLVVKDLKRTMSKYRDKLQQDHRTKRFVDSIQENARKLVRCELGRPATAFPPTAPKPCPALSKLPIRAPRSSAADQDL